MTDKIRKAMLSNSPILLDSGNTPCLDDFLAYVRTHSGEDVQGLAFATNGTWPVLGFDKCSSTETPKLSVTPINGRYFDPTKVFELRLWVPVELPDEAAEGDVLAREFRWVNGVDSVELTLTSGKKRVASDESESTSICGWAHEVSYLKHTSATNSNEKSAPDANGGQTETSKQDTATKDMTAVEFIQEEQHYGNTVVVDQLFTGRWK